MAKSEMPKRQPVPDDVVDIPPATRERVRLAIIELTRRKEKLTIRGLRNEAGCDQNACSRVLRAHQAGRMPQIFQPWDEQPRAAAQAAGKSEDKAPTEGGIDALIGLINDADTHDKRDDALRAVGVALVRDEISASGAQQLRSLIGEMRLQDKDRRTVPQEDPERIYLLGQDGARLVSAFEKIVSNERRAKALAAVADLLEEDARELPAVDPVGRL